MFTRDDLQKAKRIVVKLGTRVCLDAQSRLNGKVLCPLAEQVLELREAGVQVILVSSGAVGMGREVLRLSGDGEHLPAKQALAAIGQVGIMEGYRRVFGLFHVDVAQVLLTREDLTDRTRYLNMRNTLLALLQYGVLPVINENDSVSTAEMRFGDNDNLAALVGALVSADVIINLTSVPGVLRPGPDGSDEVVDTIDCIGPEIEALDKGVTTSGGTGGLTSKLQAAAVAVRYGGAMIIAPAREPRILTRVLAGEKLGTLFVPAASPLPMRKRWLASGARPSGALQVDVGAARALLDGEASLLAVGVTAVSGEFLPGDLVSVLDAEGREIARGLCNYGADEARRIMGLPSGKIAQVLGHSGYAELVHHDNLVLL